jgi:midasin
MYYSKCLFKLKLLTKVLLSPNVELGFGNLERIKGFAIDFFRLVQKERKQLGKQVKHICELRKVSRNLNDLNDFVQHVGDATADQLEMSFDANAAKLTTIRNAFCVVQNGLAQFLLLLKCAPAKLEENLCVFEPKPASQIHQQSEKFKTIKRIAEKLLAKAVASLVDMDKHDFEHTTFHSVEFVTSCESKIQEIHQLIEELKEEFLIKDELYSVYGKSIFYLDEFLNEVREEIGQAQEEAEITEVNNVQIDKDLEAAVQTMLLALQSVYKIHSSSTEAETVPTTEENDDQDEQVSEIEERHLTEKIIGKMMEDLKQLNVKQTILKTSKFLELIKSQSYAKCEQQQLITKLLNLRPLLEQYSMLCEYYLIQQLGAHKVSTKMLCVMLTVFIELGSKVGF